jgi:hypothetical protein
MMFQPLIAAALIAGQAAQAAQPAPAASTCVTREEARDMTVAFLPLLVTAVAQRCRPHLGATAFLTGRADPWIERLRREAQPRRGSALRGLAKATAVQAPPGVGGESAFDFIAAIATAGVVESIRPESCGDIDAIAEAASPLPPENVGRLVASTLSLATSGAPAEAADEAEPDGAGEEEDAEATAGQGERRRAGPVICPS